MKLSKIFFVFLLLSIFQINYSFAGGTHFICPGVDSHLTWSSTNAVDCTGGLKNGNPLCNFRATTETMSQPITGAILGCTVDYSCTAANVLSQDDATLEIYAGAELGKDHHNPADPLSDPLFQNEAWVNCCNQGSALANGWTAFNPYTNTCDVPPTGWLSASACVIPAGQSTCTSKLSWGTDRWIGTSAITANVPYSGTSVFVGNSGTNKPVTIHGDYKDAGVTFYLYNNETELSQVNVKPVCSNTSGWNNVTSVCEAGYGQGGFTVAVEPGNYEKWS